MKVCYVDEAGCTGALPCATSPIQPVLVLTGFIIDYSRLHELTSRLLALKRRFYPNLAPAAATHLGWMLHEVKGAEIRRDACSTSRNMRRHAFGYMGEVMKLVEDCEARVVGRVWVKGIGQPLDGMAVYTYSIQSIYADFHDYLARTDDLGMVIVDSRLKHLNTQVAHSIFTQKFKSTGDRYDRIIELPAFSHSDNHAGLQVADMMCSAFMTPIAIHTYCAGHIQSVHVRPGYGEIKTRFADRCRKLQHRYQEADGKTRGGYVVSDGIAKRVGGRLFRT
jgi:hypothetical protein